MFRGQNREWQWESRVEGVHAGGDQKGGTFNRLTFRQVEMVQDRGGNHQICKSTWYFQPRLLGKPFYFELPWK